MSELVTDCPRCGAKKITFKITQQHPRADLARGWKAVYECFCICRHCNKTTTFLLEQRHQTLTIDKLSQGSGGVNGSVEIQGFVSLKDFSSSSPPDFLPPPIEAAFREGATSLAVGCPNAAGTMFRLCVDLATVDLLPAEEKPNSPNAKVRRDLGLRLPWLFDNGLLPDGLRELSECVKDDGNDSAHRGTLKTHEAQDMEEFTFALLDRLYSERERVRVARERKVARAAEAAKGTAK